MNYRSFNDLHTIIQRKIDIIPSDVDMIVGVPRSGLLVASILSLLLNKQLTDLNGLLENRIISNGNTKNQAAFLTKCSDAKSILVVEDSVSSGQSILECKKRVEDCLFLKDSTVKYCAIYVAPDKKDLVDYFFEIVDTPRLFEWNIFHHKIIEKSCFDIDGVLCRDPSSEENDNGVKYKQFLTNVTPKILPSRKIGAIVTSRLKEYENETVSWMEKNHVRYGELVMMDCSFEERRKKANHGAFKAYYYKKSDYVLFVESDENQAIEINNISGKPVYCTSSGSFYDGNRIYKIKNEKRCLRRIRRLIKKIPGVMWLRKRLKKKAKQE